MSLATIAGTIAASKSGSEIVNSHAIGAYGMYGTPTYNAWASASLTADGSYSLQGLLPGSYYTYGVTYFDAPYGYVQYPTTQVDVTAGATTTRNFGGPLAFLRGAVALDGFFQTSALTSGTLVATGDSGALAVDWLTLPQAAFDLAVPVGDWKVDGYSLSIANSSGVNPIEVSIECPPLIAAIEQPLPKCKVMTLTFGRGI